ncbi:hypothetical protein AAIB33_06495 [Microbacterium sp. AZCO]|uniref:hypothetical protein n=1 Tax=Microbacterium sp. AZCO TaxID=3142976 RepID=UPI0031F40A1F
MPRQSRKPARRIGQAVAMIAVSVAAFVTAVVFVFAALMWGDALSKSWGVSLAILIPLALTLATLVLVLAQKLHVHYATGGRTVTDELRAMFKTDLN